MSEHCACLSQPMTRDEALKHFLEVFGVSPAAKTNLRAAFAAFVRASRAKGTVTVEFELVRVTCSPPSRRAAAQKRPRSFARLLSHHASVRLETQVAGSPWCALLVRDDVVDRDEGWLEGTPMQKLDAPIVLAAYVDQHSDLYCYDPTRKTGREPALVFLSHEGGRGTVSKVPIAALVAERLAKLCRTPTKAPPVRMTRPTIVDGGLKVDSKSLATLRPLLERLDEAARATVTGLLCTSPLTTTDGIELLPNLEYARLEGLRLKDLAGVEALPKLRRLNAKRNLVTTLPRMRSLTRLELSGNRITSMEGLEALENLEVLEFDDNPIARIEGLERLPRLERVTLPQACLRITGASLDRLMKLDRSNEWALALAIDGAVPARLAAQVDQARFRHRVSTSRETGAAGIRALAAEALTRDSSDLAFAAEHSHRHTPTAEEVLPWAEFLEQAAARAPAMEQHLNAFRASTLGDLANTAEWGKGHEHALRDAFLSRFVPRPITDVRVAIALALLHASRKERDEMLDAVKRAFELGAPRRHIALRDPFKPFLRNPAFKALLATAKDQT